MTDLDHADLTAMGLFFEAHAGLRSALEKRLEGLECLLIAVDEAKLG